MGAMNALQNARNRNEILTGLLFVATETKNLHHTINSSDRPLNALPQEELCPGSSVLADINDELR